MMTKTPIKKHPQTKRITSRQHKDDLKALATASPKALAKAVVQGFGFQKSREIKGERNDQKAHQGRNRFAE